MGTCTSAPASTHSEAETMVPGGADSLRACFLLCLKLDLYQPKYANMPITFTVKPCPRGADFIEGYGVGTVFEGINAIGQPEVVTIKELVSLEKIVLESRGLLMTYSTTLLPNGDCKLQFAFDGPNMGRFQQHVVMQINTMGSFAKANLRAILDEADGKTLPAPPVVGASPPGPPPVVGAASGGAFCGGCGAANSGAAFCTGCGAASGGAVAGGGGFVDVPQHAQAQQAAQNMMQQSMMNATIKASSMHAHAAAVGRH